MDTRGFSLIEVIVSISILALSITAIVQLFSGSLRSISVSDDYTQALLVAREVINNVKTKENLSEEAYSEDIDDKYNADVFVEEIEQEKTESTRYSLFKITVVLNWEMGNKERSFSTSTTVLNKKNVF